MEPTLSNLDSSREYSLFHTRSGWFCSPIRRDEKDATRIAQIGPDAWRLAMDDGPGDHNRAGGEVAGGEVAGGEVAGGEDTLARARHRIAAVLHARGQLLDVHTVNAAAGLLAAFWTAGGQAGITPEIWRTVANLPGSILDALQVTTRRGR
ncbi:hypothetical protein [Actinopolymorpha alba]|uniref:hypothetical protein n=1 Tax=Actinopolymorpha alba TaxID=533267 RepID=UPI000377808B|nr:hypothetical protein [Actinopolymorpha alba]